MHSSSQGTGAFFIVITQYLRFSTAIPPLQHRYFTVLTAVLGGNHKGITKELEMGTAEIFRYSVIFLHKNLVVKKFLVPLRR